MPYDSPGVNANHVEFGQLEDTLHRTGFKSGFQDTVVSIGPNNLIQTL